MKFLHPDRDNQLELSLDDVFIVPNYFDGTSRMNVNLFRETSSVVLTRLCRPT